MRISGRLIDRASGQGVQRAAVEACSYGGGEIVSLKTTTTDDEGQFTVDLGRREGARLDGDPQAFVFFRAYLPGEKQPRLDTHDTVRWQPREPDAPVRLVIDVTDPSEPADRLVQFSAALSTPFSATVERLLAERDLRTLADLRRAGGIRQPPASVSDVEVEHLNAAASLSVLPLPAQRLATLAEAGVSSPAALGMLPLNEITRMLGETSGDEAQVLRSQARIINYQMANALLQHRASAVGEFAAFFAVSCDCDCASATSLQAYLVQLVRFTLSSLRYNGNSFDIGFLQGYLRQPLRELPATCESTEPITRARIAVEVLRKDLRDRGLTAAAQSSPRWYREPAYLELLDFLGLSYDEMRAVAGRADPYGKAKYLWFAGLMVGDLGDPARVAGAASNFDVLYRDVAANPPAPEAIDEDWLQVNLGLRSTLADPLSPDPGRALGLDLRESVAAAQWIAADAGPERPLGLTPIIDPHLISELDLRDVVPSPSSASLATWKPIDYLLFRRVELSTAESVIAAGFVPGTGPSVAQKVKDLFPFLATTQTNGPGSSPSLPQYGFQANGATLDYPTMRQIRADADAGVDVSATLSAFAISEPDLRVLVAYVEALDASQPITAEEQAEARLIISNHVKRAGLWPQWRRQEGARQLALAPDLFRDRVTGTLAPDPQWRPSRRLAEEAERRRWEDVLYARTRVIADMTADLSSRIRSLEVRLLPEVRDHLAALVPPGGALNQAKVESLTDHYQIDLDGSGAELTTRAGQAIETVQGLLFGARNGLLNDTAWTIAADDFDEVWRWFGSYDTWRSAMTVFLFPESILRGSVHRDPSPGLRAALELLRDGAPVGVQEVVDAYATFADYLNDVASLDLVAAVPRTIATQRGADDRVATYLLGVTRRDGAARTYWSVAVDGGFAQVADQSWWHRIDALNATTHEIMGGAICGDFVVVITSSAVAAIRSLSLWRLPLGPSSLAEGDLLAHAPDWEGPFELELPGNTNTFLTVTVQGGGADAAPVVTIEADESTLYSRSIDLRANGWTGQFRSHANAPIWRELGTYADGLMPSGGATFACQPGTGPANTADSRFVLAADVDGDGADEVVAFAGVDGFWSMKMKSVGQRNEWLPLGNRTASYDCPLTLRSMTTLYHIAKGDFDGDRAEEIAVITDGDGGSPSIELVVRKFDGATASWVALGSVPTAPFDVQFVDPVAWRVPVGVQVGRFTQSARDELLVTYRDARYGGDVAELAVLGFVSGSWQEVATALVPSAFGGTSNRQGGSVCTGRFLGTSRYQVLLEQIGPGFLSTGKFWTLEYANGSWRSIRDLDAGTLSSPVKLVAADFDGDGFDELAVADNSTSVRFFKYELGSWTSAQSVVLSSRVEHLAAGDVRNDGRASLIVHCAGNPITGLELHMGDPAPAPASLNLTLGSAVPARALVAGRFAGRQARAGVATLGAASTFYVQARIARAPVARPGFLQYKPFLTEEYRLHDAATDEFRLAVTEVATAGARTLRDNATNRPRNRAYLEEAYFHLIVEVALRLQESTLYGHALHWFTLVTRLAGTRLASVCEFLRVDAAGGLARPIPPSHVDPFDTHAIARVRAGSYNRFTIAALVRLLVDYGEAEFSFASAESLVRARELLITALALLKTHPYAAELDRCESEIAAVLNELAANPATAPLVPEVRDALSAIEDMLRLIAVSGEIRRILASAQSGADKVAAIRAAVEPPEPEPAPTVGERIALTEELEQRVASSMYGKVDWGSTLDGSKIAAYRPPVSTVLLPAYSFCLPAVTPLLELKRRIELALGRLRGGLDIAGNELVVAALHDAGSASPGNVAAAANALAPVPYRYETLVDRSRQLLEIARQMEASMLDFIETSERKRYEILNARRDLGLATVAERLRAVQVHQATDEYGISVLQRDRSQDQVDKWSQLIRDGLNEWEKAGLAAQWTSFGLKQLVVTAVIAKYAASAEGWASDIKTWGMDALEETSKSQAEAADALSQASRTQAEFDRRAEGWAWSRREALRDVQIGDQQIRASASRLRGAQIEQEIASLQTSFARDMVTFLTTTSFANEVLYEWMAGVLEGTYRFFLQQATQLARLAELQLAFERQEVPRGFIKRNYWNRMRSNSSPDVAASPHVNDAVRGLTGAATLLRDLYQLDQHAFLRNQRKHQLTHTISLARHDPLAFAQMSSSGRIVFDTPMELFDQRFPGHYLRLIRRVRLSVIALIPSAAGISATLSNSGVSRVLIRDGDRFSDAVIRRGLEQVAFSTPINATGQFELDAQPELLNPFEGTGVDTRWVLDLPRPANPIRYDSLADILVTFEYTALSSSVLRAATIEALPKRRGADRVFSLRYDFPDAWYDLYNPPSPTAPVEATFSTARTDFPPELDDVRVTNLVLLVRFRTTVVRLNVDELRFVAADGQDWQGGSVRLDQDGVVSTRRGSGAPWYPIVLGAAGHEPAGEWRLRFADTARAVFGGDGPEDIIFVVSFEGHPVAWP